MIDFFDFLLIGPFKTGNWFIYFLGVLMWFCFLIIAGLFLYGILTAIDSWFMPELKGKGKIIAKDKVDAHSTTTFTKVGNVTVPQTRHYKDAYYVTVEIDGKEDKVCVKKKFYKNSQIGDVVECAYNLGRLFDWTLYIDEIY